MDIRECEFKKVFKSHLEVTFLQFFFFADRCLFLTIVEVGVKGQRAVLHVKGEVINIKVTGADNFGRLSVTNCAIAVYVNVRNIRCCVFIHAVDKDRTEQNVTNGEFSFKNRLEIVTENIILTTH